MLEVSTLLYICNIIVVIVLSAVVPVVTITPMNQTVVSPNTVMFNCSATAKPQAEIQWMRGGMVLNNTLDGIMRIAINLIEVGDCIFTRPPSKCVSTSTLEITSTIPDDVGEYVCSATNPVGSMLETALLTIHGKSILVLSTFLLIIDVQL